MTLTCMKPEIAEQPLIPTDEFVGLSDVIHLAAGGESPMLQSHQEAFAQFSRDKSRALVARELQAEKIEQTRLLCAQLLHAAPSDITFLSSASDGINAVMYGMNWEKGDNVVVADIEFASGTYPWTRLQQQGVEVRIVRHRDWMVDIEEFEARIDARTRVVLLSHVSMSTGQRIDLEKLSRIVRDSPAKLLLDATHAVGVVPVVAPLADVVVSSCYKWLLGTHGTSIFYWNRESFPELQTAFLGWNSASSHAGWQDPLSFELKPDTHRFQPGNANFLGVYLLCNALQRLLPIGEKAIEQHALALTGKLHNALSQAGYQLMTPASDVQRAGNICFEIEDMSRISEVMSQAGILIWGAYASAERVRISAHVYNSRLDIDACIAALKRV